MSMDKVDRILLRIDEQHGAASTIIVCLYTGPGLPPHCAPMPRVPEPLVGMIFDDRFPAVVAGTLASNPAVHDGAIMIGRRSSAFAYHVVGWSYRLYPPQGPSEAEANRGSAFSSCLAMSGIGMIDRVYLISKGGALRFEKNAVKRILRQTESIKLDYHLISR
jgi:hypothetical protein